MDHLPGRDSAQGAGGLYRVVNHAGQWAQQIRGLGGFRRFGSGDVCRSAHHDLLYSFADRRPAPFSRRYAVRGRIRPDPGGKQGAGNQDCVSGVPGGGTAGAVAALLPLGNLVLPKSRVERGTPFVTKNPWELREAEACDNPKILK